MELVELGKVFKISSGGTPSRKKNEYYENGKIPWVKTGDLKPKYINEAIDCITKEGLDNSSAKLFPKETVLIAMYGATIGATSILGIEASTNQACAGFLPTEKCLPTYLYYFFKANQTEIIRMGVGGAQPNISAGLLKKVKIPLPPLPTQKKIASILDEADTLRQLNKQLIATYDALTQSLFLDMFGDPVTNPKGWEKVKFNKICSFDKVSIKPENIISGTFYIGLESIEKETGKILGKVAVKENELKSNKFYFDKEYILYGKLRPYLNKVGNPDFEGICSTDIIPLKPLTNKSNKQFVTSIMRSSGFVSWANERCSGANLPRISPKEVEKYLIINPPIHLQNQFAERVKLIEQQKQQVQTALQKSDHLFNSLLQKAFKGELV